MSISKNFLCQCLHPHREPQLPPTSAVNLPILAGRSGPVSYRVTAFFSSVLMHTGLCVCPPRVEFLFSPVLWKSYNQITLAFRARFSRDSSFHCQTPRLGILMWGSELSLKWETLCGIIVFQSVDHPPCEYGI